MRLLRLAIETRKWDLAAHVLILGALRHAQGEREKAIKARQSDNDKPRIENKKKYQKQGKKA
jgi:ribosomal protein S30